MIMALTPISPVTAHPRACRPRVGHLASSPRRREGVAAFALLMMLMGCATTRVDDGFLIDEARGFKIPLLGDGWTRIEVEGVEIAYRAEPGEQLVALFVSCNDEQGLPLRILARRLFFGIGAKQVLSQEPLSLDGAEAIHTLLEGRLRESDVTVSSYVTKDTACVYDLVYVATPGAFPKRLPEFERFVRGLAFTTKRAR